ncbi:unnamed protein product [Callosobruchus maculatus]|uniref:Uncharacterized protein n=1 Tax=Callosobruchus maculatus TaxID=64391 RepID=A0A653DQM9_CALMS|nr:unnamed protein product [Callosobruchus maculatus]
MILLNCIIKWLALYVYRQTYLKFRQTKIVICIKFYIITVSTN